MCIPRLSGCAAILGTIAAVLVSLAAPDSALARTYRLDFDSWPVDTPIPDGDYIGTPCSMAASTISVYTTPDTGPDLLVAAVSVEVVITHANVGDLVIKLQSPSGMVVTLMHYPGLSGVNDEDACCGHTANFAATVPILFDDDAASGVGAESIGAGVASDQTVGAPANGSPDNYVPDAGDLSDSVGGPLPDSLDTFVGENARSFWKLYIGDGKTGSAGTLHGWTLHLLVAEDCDGDGVPDDAETDTDGDRVPDDCDNCPATDNPIQEDLDGDGIGDVCDDSPACATAGPAAPLLLAVGTLLLHQIRRR
jgi:subtilisin-like proprotein convertase family protein